MSYNKFVCAELCAYLDITVEEENVYMLLGAIEGGGTKFVCAVGEEDGKIIDRVEIPTRNPKETMADVTAYFKDRMICGLGLASFGPVNLDKESSEYGCITTAAIASWRNYNILETLKRELKVPCEIDTDVNGAALGEATYGALRRVTNGMYITIGTGIGTGIYINGNLVHGMLHPEGGHIFVKRHPEDDFPGICDYHKDCLEGLASGPAIEARAGRQGSELAPDDRIWTFVSYYIAQAICDYIFVVSPQKIVLGGGVMSQKHLYPMIRNDVVKLMGDYMETEQLKHPETFIVPAQLKGNQAIMGALKLAYNKAIMS